MTNRPSLSDRALITVQRLLPARTMGRLVYRLSRNRMPWLKNLLIRGFCRLFGVDTTEASLSVPEGYESFNAFFTRELQAGKRSFDAPADALICPADGTLAHGGIADDTTLLQAKGMSYPMQTLLADDEFARCLAGSAYHTVYLAPYDYHRLHMPLAGRLTHTVFVPGRLYSVNARTTAALPGLYALNERLVCGFEGDSGPFALVLVGAMNVASISTAWAGEYPSPPDGKPVRTDFAADSAPFLERGDYLGHFNMGSTVVVLASSQFHWDPTLNTGDTVRVGQIMARGAAES